MKKLMPVLGMIVVLAMLLSAVNCAGPAGRAEPPGAATLLPSAPKPKVETPVTITWLGHAAFKLESGGKTILIDPWIKGNPQCPIKVEDIAGVDLILVTHDHFDHVGDTIAIAKGTGATVVAMFETAAKLQADGLPKENILYGGYGRNIGGAIQIDGVTIVMTEAFHSSSTGSPAGYILKFPGGATVYHAGDTGIFANMQVYGCLYPIHVALLPIGGVFTMDGEQAAKSLRLLNPSIAIPMHFATFPILAPNADDFVGRAKKDTPGVQVVALRPGQSYTLQPGAYE